MSNKDDKQILIRTAAVEDAPQLLNIYAPYVRDTAVTFEYDVPLQEEFAERIRCTLRRYPYLVAQINGEAVGYAYAGAFQKRTAYNWAAETSIYVKQNKRGLGIGKALYRQLEYYLKLQNIVNLNACIASTQTKDEYLTNASILFHERLGFRLVGEFSRCGYKFHRWYNMVWMEKIIGEHLEIMPEVKTFAQITKM